MDVSALEVGQTYYKLTFADKGMTMPSVKPLVYIGQNLFEADTDLVMFYFQDTVSYIVHGSANAPQSAAPSTGVDILVSPFNAEEVALIYDLAVLLEKVNEAAERAMTLGYPKLQRCSGKWIEVRSNTTTARSV